MDTESDRQTDKRQRESDRHRDRRRQRGRESQRNREQNKDPERISDRERPCRKTGSSTDKAGKKEPEKHRDTGERRRSERGNRGGSQRKRERAARTEGKLRSHTRNRCRDGGSGSPGRGKARGRGSQQGREWPRAACSGASVPDWCMCVLECFLCVHLPATDSRLWYMPELVPGATRPGRRTALPQQPGAAVYFSLSATQKEYHEILLRIWARVPLHALWEGSKPTSCAPSGCAGSSLKTAPFVAPDTFQRVGGVSKFGGEHASPLSQLQTSS